MKLKLISIAALLMLSVHMFAQEVKLDNLKEQFSKDNLFRLGGGVSANTVFYNGTNKNRDPFNWILAGNINLSFYNQFNLPFSFNLNNLGGNYTYPTMPNRISVHPSYKWITGHLGDVAMTFSPYTLAGHQFTGTGVELTPSNTPFKVALMYGRLLKATEYDSTRLGTTAFKRMGYGANVVYEKEKYLIGMSVFRATDYYNSLSFVPDSLGINPMNNTAISLNTGLRFVKNLVLTAEYGLSMLTRDTRFSHGDAFFEKLFRNNTTTSTYHALKTNLNYTLKKNTIGLGYERIDPQYQSLGAYYFVNDLENFTLSFARPFFEDKLTFALNVGLQHDNLDKRKAEETERFVGAVNLAYAPSEKLNMSLAYSNFQTYTNIKSQFDYINESTNYDNLDTLSFTQLSQNVNFNLGYSLGSEQKKHNFGWMFNYQETADKQDNIIKTGGVSRFYNTALNYGLLWVPSSVQLTASLNFSGSDNAGINTTTYGPVLALSARMFKKKLTSGTSVSYNTTTAGSVWQANILNLRFNVGYRFLQKHNLNFILLDQIKNRSGRESLNDLTATISYSFSF